VTATQKLFAAVALSFMSAISWADGKIVVLDPTAAVMSTAAAKARFEKMQKGADFAATKAKLDGLTADIKALQAAYKKDSAVWDDAKRAESEKKMQSLATDYQFEGKKLQNEQQALAQQIMQEMGPKMEAIVKQLVESEKITMIVDAKAVMMAKPENDLTPKVTELLNKAK
jgi:outer membrane protein